MGFLYICIVKTKEGMSQLFFLKLEAAPKWAKDARDPWSFIDIGQASNGFCNTIHGCYRNHFMGKI